MKKTGKILSILVIAVLLIVIIVSNNTNAAGPVNFVSSVSENQSINIGDTFNITFKPTPVANGDGSTEPVKFNMMNFSIDYDPSVFEYKASTSNPELTVNAYENKISVVYNIQNKSDVSMDSLTITFKAIKETESDGSTIAIVEDNFSIGLSNRTEPVAYSNLISEGAILSAKVKVNPNQPTPTFEDPILDKNAVTVEIGKSVNVNIEPEILIVDEALSVGDEEFKKKCIKKINEIIKKDNVTLLFVTHSTDVAIDFCKRGIVMKKGKIICDTDIDKAIENYNSTIK